MRLLFLIPFCIPFISLSQSPGGVSSNLQMWLKADAGISVTSANVTGWTDQTAVNTFTVTGTPQFIDAGLNYNPTIRFTGSSRFTGNTTITGITHAFAVGKIVNASGASGSGALIGSADNPSGDYFFHTEGGRLYAGNTSVYTGYNTSNSLPFNVYSEDLSKTPAAVDIIRINGSNTVNHQGNDPAPYNRAPTLGSRATENMLTGSELAEAVLYNASAGSTNTTIIESYLAIKYGITLNNAGGSTAGDYLSAAGATIWDASNGSGYHNQVVGIARDDNSGLLQKQSHSSDDTIRIYLSSLQATNAANSGSFSGDAQFVMVGNNQGNMFNTYGNTEFPSGQGIYSRLSREWKITNTNFDGQFTLDIKPKFTNITAAHLRILVDDDGDFTNAVMYSPVISYSTGVVTVSGISAAMIPVNSTRYFTLVSLSASTTLPVGLTLFAATALDDSRVQLDWQTGYESNSDFFGIERSTAIQPWQEIGKVNGAGSSSQLLSYRYTDNHPAAGISYYRLKQTDKDGQYTYSDTRAILLRTSGSLKIYPNPAINLVVIEADEQTLKELVIYDVAGRNINGLVGVTIISNTQRRLDLSRLSPGIYYIRVGNEGSKLVKD